MTCILVTAITIIPGPVLGYEQPTHRSITGAAVANSILGDVTTEDARERRSKLGLRQAGDRRELYTNAKQHHDRSALQLIEDGVDFEDDGVRALNHFTDPRTGKGLNVYGSSTSVDWALGTLSTFHFPSQDRSYIDLKRYYLQALLGTSPQTRKEAMALTFQTLGHIVHHIQDAAQPQHTRNDAHLSVEQLDSACEIPTLGINESLLCRFYLSIRNPSFYEKWTRDLEFTFARDLPMRGYDAVYGRAAVIRSWPGVPRSLFVGEGRGIAEYSNRNFLTSGTMSEAPPALGDPYDMTVAALCQGAVPPCGPVNPAYLVRFRPSVVDDRLRTGSAPHPYAASSSIYSPDFSTYGIPTVNPPMTVNRFTFDYHYAYLLPRAVGYSAGFVNYFFRGDFDVDVPDEGAFAALNLDGSGCGGCTFPRVKLKLRNSTPDEAVGQGDLYLVARYSLNECFLPDLSGEDGATYFQGANCRSTAPRFLVSKPLHVDAIPGDEHKVVVFAFDAPGIPVSASDISFQVIFRGELGMESDAIVVSTLDISEPNYVAVGNLTDYVFYTGDDRYSPLKTGDSKVLINKVTFSFQDPASGAPPLATVTNLTGGEHAQFAFITTKGTRNYWLRTESTVPFPYTDNAPFRVEEFFKDDDMAGSVYSRTCQVTKERGRYRQYSMYYAQTVHGRVSGAVPGGAQPAALQKAESPGMAKYAADCKGSVPPGTYGMFDLSYLTPYTNANAKPWTINFP